MVKVPLSNGARIFRDTEWPQVCHEAAHSVVDYMNAVLRGDREPFIEKFGLMSPNHSDVEIIEALISKSTWDKSLETFQCEYCGRIWIENSLSDSHYRSFKPDKKWRGTFEAHEAGFLSYEAETIFYGCRLKTKKRRSDILKVTFESTEGQRVVAQFSGVKSVEERIPHDPLPFLNGLCVKHLGKWQAEKPYYRYVFEDYFSRNEPGYLAIIAKGFELKRKSVD